MPVASLLLVAEAVLFFKLMPDGQVWLLWCQSLAVVSKAAAHHLTMGSSRWGDSAKAHASPTFAAGAMSADDSLPKLSFRAPFWVADAAPAVAEAWALLIHLPRA